MGRKSGVGVGYIEVCNGVRQRGRLSEIFGMTEGEMGQGCGEFYD